MFTGLLLQASEEVGRVASEQTSRRRADESAPSSTCSLAMAADRLANALYDVLDVFNRGSRPGSPNEEVLADLRRLATPLATELERVLASEGVVQTPINVMFVSKASLYVNMLDLKDISRVTLENFVIISNTCQAITSCRRNHLVQNF